MPEIIDLNYEYLYEQKDLDRVISWLSDRLFFCIDTETLGTDPIRNKLILIQIGNQEKQWVIDCRSVDIRPLRPFFEDDKHLKLGQNIRYDIQVLSFKFGWEIRNVACTMIAEQVLRCGSYAGASMEALAQRYLRLPLDKDTDLRTSFGYTGINQFSKRQLDYAAGDVCYPVLIAKKQKELISRRGLKATLSLEHKVIPVLAKMELTGMLIDPDKWRLLSQKAVLERRQSEIVLDSFFGVTPLKQGNFFGEEEIQRAINYNSSVQVKKALSSIGYIVPDTEKETIALMAIEGMLPRELAQAILSFRMATTKVTRYGLNFLSALDPITGRVHSNFKQAATTSGRLSSGADDDSAEVLKVNLQNIPSESDYRQCFIPRPGYKYIVYDFQAIEPRILGEISLDPTYLKAFDNPDGDIYGVIGEEIYGEVVSKAKGRPSELRAKTKIVVLGNSYGTGKNKFHKKLLMDLNMTDDILHNKIEYIQRDESDHLWERFFEICPKIRETLDDLSSLAEPLKSNRRFFDDVAAQDSAQNVYMKCYTSIVDNEAKSVRDAAETAKKLAARKDFVTYSETIGGRKRFFKVTNFSWWTEGRNTPIQGTAADILKTAMVDLYDKISQHGNDAVIVNQVHDELIVECKESECEEVNSYTKSTLVKAGAKFLKRVPCVVSGGIVDKWEKN